MWAVRLHAGASRHMLALQPGMAAAVALAAKTGVGGKNDKAAKDGDEAGDLMSPAELRGALKKADTRGKPSSCVVGLTRDKRAVILVDHLPKPRKLLASAKAQGQAAGLDLDLASLRFGRMSVSGKQVDITVNKAVAPALELKLRPVMRAAAHPAFTINADPAIEDEPEDGADRDGAGAVPGRAGPGTPGPGPSPGLAVPAAAAAASVNGSGAIENGTAAPRSPLAGMVPPDLARGVQAAVAADPSRKPALARLLAQVRAGVESGDPHAAEAEIAALRQALDAAPPLPGEERTAQGRAAGAGQAASAPATPAEGPRLMQADATLADLARAWDAEQAKAAPGGLARQGGPKAPAPPASKRATAPAPFSGGEGLLSGQSDRTAGLAWPGLPGDDGGLGGAGLATPVFQGHGNRPVPPAGRAPALQAPGQAPAPLGRGGSVPSAGRAPPPQASSPLPPGLVPEVQGPSPLPGGRTVAREGLRAGGRAAGRFLVTKPNPYLMVAGVVLLVAMELMPRADEGGGEATVTLRQHGAGGQPGREVATLHMDQTGALRAEPGGRGAVLGQMDPAGRITLTPAGEAYLAERAKGVQAPPAPGGFPGGAHDAMGNWTGPGAPGEGSPQPAAPGPADAAAPPRPGTPRLPQEPAPGQGSQRPAWLKEIEGVETFDADEREFVQAQAQGGMKHADIVRALDERRRGGVGALRRDQMTPEERRAEGKRRGARDKLDGVEVLDDQERAIAEAMAALGKPRIEIANALLERRGKLGTAPKPGQARPEVTQKIEEALKSDDPKVRLEGEIASFLLKSGIDVANFQQGFGPGNSLGEIDVETDKAIIEATTENARKTRQIKERVNNPILNPDGKTPILYSENYGRRAQQEIESAGGRVARSPQELLDIIRKLGD